MDSFVDILKTFLLTNLGILVGVSAVIVFVHASHSVFKERKVHKSRAKTSTIVFNGIVEAFGFLLRVFPKVLICVLAINVFAGVTKGIATAVEWVNNEKRIKELKAVVKNLSKEEKLAEIELISVNMVENGFPECKYRITLFSSDEQRGEPKEYTLKGNEIFLDFWNINFEYSEIASGKKGDNFAIPYRIFSDVIPSDNAIKLDINDSQTGIPVTAILSAEGIKADAYLTRFKELLEISQDSEKAKEFGIRSSIGSAIHVNVNQFINNNFEIAYKFVYKVENTGGIVVERKDASF